MRTGLNLVVNELRHTRCLCLLHFALANSIVTFPMNTFNRGTVSGGSVATPLLVKPERKKESL